MAGIRERSARAMERVPSLTTRPWHEARETCFPISFSSTPSARERAFRLAVTFITPLPPGRLWKKRSELVVLAIFGASNSPPGISSTSITADRSRINSMNSRTYVMPPCYAVRCELHSDKSTSPGENSPRDFFTKKCMIRFVTQAYRGT